MVDNFQVRPGSGADPVLRLVNLAGVFTQVMKLDLGGASAESLVVIGQQVMAASVPVVIASDHSNIPVILASNSGVDIGDVTVNNSTGAWAVNIQDGGNSITTDPGSGWSEAPLVTASLTGLHGVPVMVADLSGNAAWLTQPVRASDFKGTFSHQRPAVTNATSVVIAAGTRKWVDVMNCTNVMAWLKVNAAAVAFQGYPLGPSQSKRFETDQAINGITETASINLETAEVV
jgi:hypothetical protein